MNGKGSKPRPLSIPQDKFSKRWEEIFGNREPRSDAEDAKRPEAAGTKAS